jgi:hypothetical protein
MKIGGFRVLPADLRPAFAARKAELDARLAAIASPEPPPAVAAPPKPSASTSASPAPAATAAPAAGPANEGNDPSDDPGAPSAPTKPDEAFDPGEGEDLVGADLSRPPTPTEKTPR